jgi:hypothetical protein
MCTYKTNNRSEDRCTVKYILRYEIWGKRRAGHPTLPHCTSRSFTRNIWPSWGILFHFVQFVRHFGV